MITQLREMMKDLQPQIVKSIQRIVAIESVQSEALVDAPFGVGPKAALLEVLKLSEELGFTTKNIDNMIGYAQYGEGDDDYIGIFGHVDIVPLGEGWIHDPLGSDIEDNKMYGRGVLDNKGPIIANLYALYAMKTLGITFNLPIRIVFGTNEESGFGCVKHFLTKEKAPVFGWTPDCKWPVVYGERGRALVRIVNDGDVNVFYKYLNDFILSSPSNGVKLGINFKDDDFGELVMRGYSLGIDDTKDYFQMALSYPGITSKDELVAKIEATLPEGLRVLVTHNWDPVVNDKHSKYIEPLTQSYEDIMGERLEPVTTTGGTYAKIIPNIIAYGPSFPGQNGIAHLPDEWMDLTDLENCSQIYALALYRLKEII